MHDEKDGEGAREVGGRVLYGIEKLQPADLAYGPELKKRCLALLEGYRADLSAKQGKPVGWAQIRDMVMVVEDREIADGAEGSGQRSFLVTTEDFKGWFSAKSSHLPSDMKFQYVLRFLRSLEVAGLVGKADS